MFVIYSLFCICYGEKLIAKSKGKINPKFLKGLLLTSMLLFGIGMCTIGAMSTQVEMNRLNGEIGLKDLEIELLNEKIINLSPDKN